MNRKTTKLLAFITAIMCITGLVSCGKDVPQSENSGSPNELNISEGTTDGGEDVADESQTTDETNDSAETTTAVSTGTGETGTDTGTTTANNGFSAVTRDPSEIPATKAPSATKVPAGTKAPVVIPATPSPNGQATKITGNAPTVTTSPQGVPTTPVTPSGTVSGITLSYYSAEVLVGQTKQYPVVQEVIPEIWTSSNENVATVDIYGNITGVGEGECVIRVVSANDSSLGAEVKVTVKKPSSNGIEQIDGITYVDGILIANKTYGLPQSYNPGGLTNDTYSAFQQLATDASYEGLNIYLSSGFRSYETQNQIYNDYVWTYGQETADSFSARPGFSEHQTGLAIDVNTIDDTFAGTPEAEWLAEHCYEYGFIIRYPQGKESITGYKYEPWHIRYVGKDVAQTLHDAAVACGDSTLTLEEYLDITSYYQE